MSMKLFRSSRQYISEHAFFMLILSEEIKYLPLKINMIELQDVMWTSERIKYTFLFYLQGKDST